MNKLILLFGVLICFMAVNARHYADRRADEESDDQGTLKPREHGPGRKRRWQSSYGYEYQAPSYYYPERRDERYNQETIQHIYRLLEDISSYLRRMPPPTPPPQPIYIPYPVALPTQVTCKTPENSTNPDLTRRNQFTDNMDQNRNWGIVAPQEEDYGNEFDGARPISFNPFVPRQLMKRPAPEVEHGSKQSSHVTEAPHFAPAPAAQSSASRATPVIPGMCNAAILSCCGISGDQQRQCFDNVGCVDNYNDSTCTTDSIQKAIDSFRTAYAPIL